MKVIYHNRSPNKEFEAEVGARRVSLAQLLHQADVVTVHVPLTRQTRHLLSWDQFRAMKKTAILVNTSRGPVVQEHALLNALQTGKIWGAGLDVFEEEAESEKGHLHIGDWQQLLYQENVILTPHIASATLEAREEMTQMAVESIMEALAGRKPKYLVADRK